MKTSGKLAAILITCAFSTTSFAQSDFEGFFAELATGYEKNAIRKINPSWHNESIDFRGAGTAQSHDTEGAPLDIRLGYTLSISDKYTLGFGIEYSPLSQHTSEFPQISTNEANQTFPIQNTSYKISERISAYVMPGFSIAKDKLIYAKIGYANQQVAYRQGTDASTQLVSGFSATKNLNGYVVGLGYKQTISKGFYGFAEANYMLFDKSSISGIAIAAADRVRFTTNPEFSGYNALIGIGYKF